MIFKGSGVAICTPFTNDGINFGTFEKMLNFQVEQGTDAIIVCGTTGEPSTMTKKEKKLVIDFCVRIINNRIPVVAGIGGNNTADVILCAKEAQDLGADGLLAVTPYYNKCTKTGLEAHFSAVADATDLPVILYNVPGRTGVNITPDSFEKLCDHRNIVAIKEASGNISQIAEMARVSRGKAAVYSGNDDQIVPLLSLGGMGVISVLANIAPAYVHKMVMNYLEGNTKEASDMQLNINPLANSLFVEVNPIPVKTALRELGFDMGPLRMPLSEMSEANYNTLKAQLDLREEVKW